MAASFIPDPRVVDPMPEFECFCGDALGSRDELIEHNVQEHDMSRAESERKVQEKYPLS